MNEIRQATKLINNSIGRLSVIKDESFPKKESFDFVILQLNDAVDQLNKLEINLKLENLKKESDKR